jgi:hypothetical protein
MSQAQIPRPSGELGLAHDARGIRAGARHGELGLAFKEMYHQTTGLYILSS